MSADPPRTDRRRALAALTGIGTGLLVAGSWVPAWSRDEAATVMVVRRSMDQVWRTWAFDPALEPFYLLMRLWAVVSTSELWLRIPSILAAVGTAVIIAAMVRRFVSPVTAWLSGLLFLILPATSRYAQEARPYAAHHAARRAGCALVARRPPDPRRDANRPAGR